MNEALALFIIEISRSLYRRRVGVFVNKLLTSSNYKPLSNAEDSVAIENIKYV